MARKRIGDWGWSKPGDRPPLYEDNPAEQADRGIISHMGDGAGGYYRMFYQGDRIQDGGDGTVWFCECPNGNMYPKSRCRHLTTLQASKRNTGTISRKVKMTEYGRRAEREKCTCPTEAARKRAR